MSKLLAPSLPLIFIRSHVLFHERYPYMCPIKVTNHFWAQPSHSPLQPFAFYFFFLFLTWKSLQSADFYPDLKGHSKFKVPTLPSCKKIVNWFQFASLWCQLFSLCNHSQLDHMFWTSHSDMISLSSARSDFSRTHTYYCYFILQKFFVTTSCT